MVRNVAISAKRNPRPGTLAGPPPGDRRRPLTPELLRAIVPQNQQRLPVEYGSAGGTFETLYAALVDGQPVAAAGVVRLWTGGRMHGR